MMKHNLLHAGAINDGLQGRLSGGTPRASGAWGFRECLNLAGNRYLNKTV